MEKLSNVEMAQCEEDGFYYMHAPGQTGLFWPMPAFLWGLEMLEVPKSHHYHSAMEGCKPKTFFIQTIGYNFMFGKWGGLGLGWDQLVGTKFNLVFTDQPRESVSRLPL